MHEEVLNYYNSGVELTRLESSVSQLEKARTQDIISRYLNKKSLKILDIGGASGAYAYWLKGLGHEVHLIDPAPGNIELAKKSSADTGLTLDAILLGNALQLPYEGELFDMVLCLGPLYHLTEQQDRVQALNEIKRVSKPGAVIFCAAISQYASMLDGFSRDLVADPAFITIMQQDLENGQHRNTTGKFDYFTTAFFHHPGQLADEITASGLQLKTVLPVESFGWMLHDFDIQWSREETRNLLLDSIRKVERDTTLLGISAHLIGIATKA